MRKGEAKRLDKYADVRKRLAASLSGDSGGFEADYSRAFLLSLEGVPHMRD